MNLAVIKFIEGHYLTMESEARKKGTQRSLVLKATEACISVIPGNRGAPWRLDRVRLILHLPLVFAMNTKEEF